MDYYWYRDFVEDHGDERNGKEYSYQGDVWGG